MESFFLTIYEWAERLFAFLGREWELRWQLYALLGGFFLLLLFLKFVYLPRRVTAQAARGGTARGGGGGPPPPSVLTCPRCRNTFLPTGEAHESFCPYCGTPAASPPWAEA